MNGETHGYHFAYWGHGMSDGHQRNGFNGSGYASNSAKNIKAHWNVSVVKKPICSNGQSWTGSTNPSVIGTLLGPEQTSGHMFRTKSFNQETSGHGLQAMRTQCPTCFIGAVIIFSNQQLPDWLDLYIRSSTDMSMMGEGTTSLNQAPDDPNGKNPSAQLPRWKD